MRQQYPPEDDLIECPHCEGAEGCDCEEAIAEDAAVARAEERQDYEDWCADQGYGER